MIELKVCTDIQARQALGIKKYGGRLSDNPAQLVERLQHLYEELLDGALYARWALEELREPARLTGWYPGTAHPVREGVYEVESARLLFGAGYAKWYNNAWRLSCHDIEVAELQTEPSAVLTLPSFKWRGLDRC